MTTPALRRRRNALLPTLVALVALLVVGLLATGVWTDRLWYDNLGFPQVFSTQLLTRVILFAGFGLLTALIVVGNVVLAYRLRPSVRQGPVGSQLLERYRELLESRFVPTMIALGGAVALFSGASAAGQVALFLAFANRTPFGQVDPRFGLDLSFFVYDLPWYSYILSFAVTTLLTAALGVAIMNYVMGGLRFGRGAQNVTTAARVHLSVLIGLAVLAFGAERWLARYSYTLETGTLLTGLTYTSDNVQVSASTILAGIAVICALLFWATIFVRRWLLPMAGLALMVVSSLILGVIYPGIVQAITVAPDEPDLERPYIAQHIAATREAYDVEDVQVEEYSADTTATAGQLRQDAGALPGIRLIDPAKVGPTFEQLQQVRDFYSFPSVLDVDRYDIDGTKTDTVVAARELDPAGVENPTWNNMVTVYTHGYGLVGAYGNRRQANGTPEWVEQDIPPEGELPEYEPRIYFGELNTGYSIVGAPEGSAPIEIDTPGGGENNTPTLNTYDGTGGVPIGNWFNRILYAIRMGSPEILLSDRVNSESRIIYDRTPVERVQAAAPWLQVDSNAYPAAVDGRIKWIVDGYTLTNNYPNSQRISLTDAITDSQTNASATTQPTDSINYIRNSVKAVVDAYDGTVTLYAWDETDPLLQTWRKAFPDSVQPRSAISDELMEHLRYPEDLYKVQRQILGKYHMTDPAVWYQENDLWEVPVDPVGGNSSKVPPYYLSVRWPQEQEDNFALTSIYVPSNRSNLAAFMAVNADASSENYGQMRVLRMSDSQQTDGPGQVFAAMTNDATVADTLLRFQNAGTAQVSYGNLLTLPVGGGLLNVMPVYVQRQASTGSYPALQFVIVRFGSTVAIDPTLQGALDQVFAGDAGASTGEGEVEAEEGEGTESDQSVDPSEVDNPAALQAINDALTANEEANQALADGDLGLYQEKQDEAAAATRRAQQALGGG
ncbi:UPF0182 family protein [Naumannella halotolerans]|uniref:UPF0182 protein CLV29_1311 n=1 Tax=Naumannella halotolerans TaxID=993414 RepID=A0A4R7J8T0_9ACTN|nr:UPF0182 family protein [Naumannella halotolerans]TDT33684.1 hypothetical protein CLV29_1311 [Naumannella halotolerans]